MIDDTVAPAKIWFKYRTNEDGDKIGHSFLFHDKEGYTPFTRTDPDTQLISTVECECDELRDKIRQRGEFCKACGEDALAELTTLQAKHLKVCGWYEKWKDQIPAESRDELNDIYLKGSE